MRWPARAGLPRSRSRIQIARRQSGATAGDGLPEPQHRVARRHATTSRSTCRKSGGATTASNGPSSSFCTAAASAARKACGRPRSACRRRCATTPSAGPSSSSCRSARCPAHWTDPEMLEMAMAALDQETAEFHGDPERTYLTGLSLGGYGAWELARAVSASLGRHRHRRRRRLLELCAGALAAGRHPARRVRPRGRPHARLALPRQRRQRGAAATERADVRRLQGRRRPRAAVDLPGAQARLLDPRLQRAGAAALAACSPRSSRA